MKKIEKLFTKEELEHMDRIFAEKKEYLKNNPKASAKFTNDKGKYDAESLDRQFELESRKNLKNFHKTKEEPHEENICDSN